MTGKVQYNSNNIQEFYDKKYSNFRVIPAFKREEIKLKAVFKLLLGHSKYSTYLDLGCGLGIKTYILASYFNNSFGVDVSRNAIAIANLLNDNHCLAFCVDDVKKYNDTIKYEVVTALGLSALNVSNHHEMVNEILRLTDCYVEVKGMFIIGSVTDFSGKASGNFHCLTRRQIKESLSLMNRNPNLKAKIFYPYRNIRFFLNGDITHLVKEIFNLAFSKRRQYFFVIQKVS